MRGLLLRRNSALGQKFHRTLNGDSDSALFFVNPVVVVQLRIFTRTKCFQVPGRGALQPGIRRQAITIRGYWQRRWTYRSAVMRQEYEVKIQQADGKPHSNEHQYSGDQRSAAIEVGGFETNLLVFCFNCHVYSPCNNAFSKFGACNGSKGLVFNCQTNTDSQRQPIAAGTQRFIHVSRNPCW